MKRSIEFALLWLTVFAGMAGEVEQQNVFIAGERGYHTYRIPAIVVATNGTVLAFAEARKNGVSDTGMIDLVLKRSSDGGQTWTAMQVIRNDGANVCGNPAPVVDRVTGAVHLLTTWNLGSDTERMIMDAKSADARRVFHQVSRDNGATWSAVREITADVKKPHWRWYATGPGNGIQTKDGALAIPANHSDHSDATKHHYRSHVIVSRDHGVTWKLGGVHEEKTNESTLVELSNGSWLQNMRSYHGKNARAVATSTDLGATWSPALLDTNLVDSVCQASMLRLANGSILFANPASKKREHMTVRVSADDAKTWTILEKLHAGPSAYSCLAELRDGTILCLYERGDKSPYEKITLARISR